MLGVTAADGQFLKCSSAIYSRDKYRAKKLYQVLGYTLEEFRRHVLAADRCYYCGTLLTLENVAADHAEALGRAVSPEAFALANLRIVCRRCNRAKGKLSEEEFEQLLAVVFTWPPVAQTDLFRRLQSGAVRYASSKRRKP